MLETIRQFAHDRLLEFGVVESSRDQHLKYFLQLAEQAEPNLRRADQIVWLDRLETDLDNFRAALAWSLEQERHVETGLRLASALMWFWHHRAPREGVDWLERALLAEARTRGAVPPSQSRMLLRAKALNATALVMQMHGILAEQIERAEEALALSRELGDLGKPDVAFALWNLNVAAFRQQNLNRAQILAQEGLVLYQELGDQYGTAECVHALGCIALEVGDYELARIHHEEDLAFRNQLGDKDGMATAYSYLAGIAFRQGELDDAAAMYEKSLHLFQDVGDTWGVIYGGPSTWHA
jgi:tetratricopeptide (TPR) repeat protein